MPLQASEVPMCLREPSELPPCPPLIIALVATLGLAFIASVPSPRRRRSTIRKSLMAMHLIAEQRIVLRSLFLVVLMFFGSLARAESPMDKRVTFSFDRTTTEKAIERLSSETGIKIELRVKELQRQGITKNHSFGIELKDATVRQALQKILLKGDPEKRLVYFIDEDGTIVVTTVYEVEMAGEAMLSPRLYG